MDVELIITFCFSLLRLATPIVYAALAASVCYKASVDNMAIESMMLWAALAGVIVSGASKSAVVGFGAAILAGCGRHRICIVSCQRGQVQLSRKYPEYGAAGGEPSVHQRHSCTGTDCIRT